MTQAEDGPAVLTFLDAADMALRNARNILDRITGPPQKAAREVSDKISRHIRLLVALQDATRELVLPKK
jgi:hypothetical protein